MPLENFIYISLNMQRPLSTFECACVCVFWVFVGTCRLFSVVQAYNAVALQLITSYTRPNASSTCAQRTCFKHFHFYRKDYFWVTKCSRCCAHILLFSGTAIANVSTSLPTKWIFVSSLYGAYTVSLHTV